MNPGQWDRMKEIFGEALEVRPDDRLRFVSKACGEDSAVRIEVERLLGWFDSRFMEETAASEIADQLIPTDRLSVGETVAHYKIEKKLGAGGMGEVYLAHDTSLDRPVAVKILSENFARTEISLEGLVHEAKAASMLNHPNTLVIYEIGKTDRFNFIVSEYVEGKTLREILGEGTLPLEDVMSIAIQIAGALSVAHEVQLVHRDIKPENIIVRPDGLVKILDFGLAKFLEKELPILATSGPASVSYKSRSGAVFGTVNYMSPEQARGENVGAQTDIFSLGLVVYEMLSGQLPFGDNSTARMFANLVAGEPHPLAELSPEVPKDLGDVVMRMLERDRELRYQAMSDVLSALEGARETAYSTSSSGARAAWMPPGARRAQNGLRRDLERRRMTAIIASFAAVAFMGLAFIYFGRWNSNSLQINSIAVLPLVNESESGGVEYISDGMTETLTKMLSGVKDLKVSSVNIVRRYKGGDRLPEEIGRELAVDAVLIGKIVNQGENELALYLSLVSSRTGSQVWFDKYRLDANDLTGLETEILLDLGRLLKNRRSAGGDLKLAGIGTENADAYRLYLQGLQMVKRRNELELRKSIDYFDRAVELDPKFAEAYARKADAYIQLSAALTRAGPPTELMAKAKEAVMKALEIDPELAEAYTFLGQIKEDYDWNLIGAERAYKRAIELDPGSATAHHYYGGLLGVLLRNDERDAELRKAWELDPVDLNIAINFVVYSSGSSPAQRLQKLNEVLQLDPNFPRTHYFIGRTYIDMGKEDEGIAEIKKSFQLRGGEKGEDGRTRIDYLLGATYAGIGRIREAREILRQMDEVERLGGYVSSIQRAEIHHDLGEKDLAIRYLERAYLERPSNMILIKRRFSRLSDDPRFKDLVRRVESHNTGE